MHAGGASGIDEVGSAADRRVNATAGPAACLVLLSERLGDKIFPLKAGTNSLGRWPDRDICVPDAQVSGAHAEVFLRDGQWFLRDLGSTNGTALNGVRIREKALRPNDRIELGGSVTLFLSDRQIGAGAAAPKADGRHSATQALEAFSTAPTSRRRAAPAPAGGGVAGDDAARIEAEVERRLAERMGEVVRVARERAELLSMAAHDLKTPLAGIMGYLECLESRVAADPTASWVAKELAVVTEAAHAMMDLLTDLLDRQRADAGRVDLALEAVDVARFLSEIGAIYERWAAGAGRRIAVHLAEPLPRVRLDRHRVSQILNNLVHNALKHTPRGGSVAIEARAPTGDEIEIAVVNEGAGFDPSDTDRMLALFERGTAAEAPIGNGHGLGLAIVDKLITLHGGKLTVEGSPGHGARFAFTLPVAGPAQG